MSFSLVVVDFIWMLPGYYEFILGGCLMLEFFLGCFRLLCFFRVVVFNSRVFFWFWVIAVLHGDFWVAGSGF